MKLRFTQSRWPIHFPWSIREICKLLQISAFSQSGCISTILLIANLTNFKTDDRESLYLEVNPKIGSSSLASCTDQKQINQQKNRIWKSENEMVQRREIYTWSDCQVLASTSPAKNSKRRIRKIRRTIRARELKQVTMAAANGRKRLQKRFDERCEETL